MDWAFIDMLDNEKITAEIRVLADQYSRVSGTLLLPWTGPGQEGLGEPVPVSQISTERYRYLLPCHVHSGK